MGGSGVEDFLGDWADVVAEAAGTFSAVLEAVNNTRIHAHTTHDQKWTAIKGWDIKKNFLTCLPPVPPVPPVPPLLDPLNSGGGVLGHVEIGSDEV